MGKSRLAPVLNVTRRRALNRALLTRTLAVVGRWSRTPRRTIVVSPSLRVLALAREAGATIVHEGARAIGLNRAVALGVARAAAEGATHVLILPIDLPYLRAAALHALVRAADDVTAAVIAPDRCGTGTNALLLPVGADFRFAFGAESFALHQTAARRAGLKMSVVRRADLRFDLDTPADLAAVTPLPYAAGAKRVNIRGAA
jgi:2-phospho-L-lactate guanylyltransferase